MEQGKTFNWASYLHRISTLYQIKPEELVRINSERVHISQKQQNRNGLAINEISEKLIQQYETRLKEKDSIIFLLRKEIKKLNDR